MADAGIKKRIARFTKPMRSATSRKGLARLTRPFRQAAFGSKPATSAAVSGQPVAVIAEAPSDSALEARLSRIEAGWSQHIPALLDSVATAIAEARRADSTHGRIDAVREDMDRLATRLDLSLLALKRREEQVTEAAGTDIEVASIAGLAAALSGGLKIQFFDGDARLPGHLAVGSHRTLGADVIARPDLPLPFGVGRAESIVVDSGYPLGDDDDSAVARLTHWLDLLEPGAKIRIRRIDFKELLVGVASAKLDVETLGADAPPQFSPVWPSAEQVAALMKDSGFRNVRITTEKGRPGRTISASRADRPGSGV